MPKFRETLIEYEGIGEVVFKEISSIKIKFKCRQLWDGSIEGDIELLESYIPSASDLEYPVEIRGRTEDEEFMIFIKSAYITHWKMHFGEEGSGITDIKFVAQEIEVKKREFSSEKPEVMTIFEITNFQSFQTSLETNVGKLTFKNYKGWKDIIKDIDIYKKACITARAYLVFKPEVRVESIAHCLELSKKEIDKVLTLTSFSQGIYQSWACISVYEKVDEKNYEVIYRYHVFPKTKNMGFHPVTHFLDLTNYLSVTYPNYTDELEEKTGLKYAIEWYLESLAADIVESKYIMAFVCLELLVDRFESVEGDKILEEDVFKMLFEKLQAETRSFLKEREINKVKRRAIYANLQGLNRYPFIEQLKKFLAFHGIGYRDLFKDLSKITKIRNNLVHTGLANVETKDLTDTYYKLMVLIQRIILAILNYDGNGYINWLDKDQTIFNRNPLNEEINI